MESEGWGRGAWWYWRMFWVRCNDRMMRKMFILKCEYLFLFLEWLYSYEILYTLFNMNCWLPSEPCRSILLMQDVWNVCGRLSFGLFFLHNVYVVLCRPLWWAGCVSASSLIFKDWSKLLELQSINSCNWFLIPTDHPQCVWLIQPYKLATPLQDQSHLVSVCEDAQTRREFGGGY